MMYRTKNIFMHWVMDSSHFAREAEHAWLQRIMFIVDAESNDHGTQCLHSSHSSPHCARARAVLAY